MPWMDPGKAALTTSCRHWFENEATHIQGALVTRHQAFRALAPFSALFISITDDQTNFISVGPHDIEFLGEATLVFLRTK
jgi:hypothetical protein